MDKKIKIDIIQLGESRYKKQWKFINKLQRQGSSNLFEISNIIHVSLGESQKNWFYYDSHLVELIRGQESTADIIIGFTDHPIEDNYFIRKIDEKIGIASFYQTADILFSENINLNNFILLVLYTACVEYYLHSVGKDSYTLYHDETRGCLFDMTGIKSDIVLSLKNMKLCSECEEKLKKNLQDEIFISELKKELKKIKKSLFYRITDWVKRHPIISLIITFIFTVFVNLISSYLFYLIEEHCLSK